MNKRGMIGLVVFIIFLFILIITGFLIYYFYFSVNVPEGAVPCIEGDCSIYCLDSDGGVDLYKEGTLALYDSRGNKLEKDEIFVDRCVGEDKINEYYCNSQDIEELYDCPNGCKEGICIK